MKTWKKCAHSGIPLAGADLGRALGIAKALALLGGCPLLTACYSTNSYLLKLDAQNQADSRLCELTSDGKQDCHPIAGQTLEAPGALTVELANTAPEKQYELELEETQRGASNVPTPDDVLQEVATRLTGLSTAFVGKLDTNDSGAAPKEASKLLTAVSTAVAGRQPAAAAALSGIAEGLKPRPAAAKNKAEIGVWKAWIDDAKHSWKAQSDFALGDTREAPPRAIAYSAADLDYVKQRASEPGTDGKAIPDKLTGDALGRFTVAFCKPDSFGNDPFTNLPWVSEPAPWVDQKDLLKKLALEPAQITALVAAGNSNLAERIGKLLTEADEAEQAGKSPSEPARILKYLFTVSRIHGELERCEHNLGVLPGLSTAAADVAQTLRDVQVAEQRLGASATAEAVFENMIAPFAIKTAVQVLTRGGNGGVLSFGTYTLHAGRMALSASSNTGDERHETLSRLEFPVRNVGPVSVSVGPFVSLCNKCIHDVKERFNVADENGVPTVHRVLDDDTASAAIGWAAMVHYSLVGGTRNQGGVALGYPLRDQTGTALGVLAGLSYRNTVGIQLTTGVHLFESQKPKGRVPLDVSSGSAATLTPDDITQHGVAAAWFFYLGATSDLLMKP